MAEFNAYGKRVGSIFELIGNKENDITKSIAWVLYCCPVFMKKFVSAIFDIEIDPKKVDMHYQKYDSQKGITDLELTDRKNFYIIVEAKRGWNLPGDNQITSYLERKEFQKSKIANKAIVTLSECSNEYAKDHLPFIQKMGIPIKHLSWQQICSIAENSREQSNNKGKNLLNELREYMGGIMTMQTKDSNWVYVVSLSSGKPDNCRIRWIDIVRKCNKYFHPVGNTWPHMPVNYVAFRYDGELKSIHHVDSYEITDNLHKQVPDMPDVKKSNKYFVYNLGPAIIPNKKVVTGKSIKWARRVYAMIDLLLTSDSIEEAVKISKDRENNKE